MKTNRISQFSEIEREENRFSLTDARFARRVSTTLIDNFIPCPITFDSVQEANIREIYRIAAEGVHAEERIRSAERRYQFSMN